VDDLPTDRRVRHVTLCRATSLLRRAVEAILVDADRILFGTFNPANPRSRPARRARPRAVRRDHVGDRDAVDRARGRPAVARQVPRVQDPAVLIDECLAVEAVALLAADPTA